MLLKMKSIDIIWLLLMLITVINAVIAETADTNLFFIVVIAISVAFKGRMVVDEFMGLRHVNWKFRAAMHAYFYVIPLMIVYVHAFPEMLAKLTSLS